MMTVSRPRILAGMILLVSGFSLSLPGSGFAGGCDVDRLVQEVSSQPSKYVVEYQAHAMDDLKSMFGAKAKAQPNEQKQIRKQLQFLSQDPMYPSLKSHKVSSYAEKFKIPVKPEDLWESYVHQGSSAKRILWSYGPDRKIIIHRVINHPK